MADKIDQAQLKMAIKALFSFIAKSKAESNDLLDDDEFISIVLSLKKVPEKARVKPFRIPLTHSLYKDKSICVFTKDPHKEYKAALQETPVQGVDKVMGQTKLRKNYRQYEDRRKLLQTYDLFVADDRIIPALPALLGKKFFDKKKHPVPVRLGKNNTVKELEKARDSTYFHLPAGPTCMVKVGLSSFPADELLENILGSIDHIVERIPKKWKNIQALYLRTPTSVALPFFNSLPTVSRIDLAHNAAPTPAPEAKRKRKPSLSAEPKPKKTKTVAKTPATKKKSVKKAAPKTAPAKKGAKKVLKKKAPNSAKRVKKAAK